MHDVAIRPERESPAETHTAVESIESAIARRAFELYCARGRQDGYDVEDWLYAEHEVRQERASTDA